VSSANDRASSGFTLIEMLVVITVIAILAAVIAPTIFRNVGDAKAAAARSQLQIFELALDAYRLDNDYYPSTTQGLSALVQSPAGDPPTPRWRGPYLKRRIPDDPWGRPYIYRSPGGSSPDGYELLSLGRDGRPGGTGEDADISPGELGR
jgi:general secretion pathway protein G